MARPALLSLPVFLLAFSTSSTQTPPPVQKVEISAPSSAEQRRNDTAGRLSVTREDIARFGDVNVSSLLKRQSGISVVNGEVRMRGLGSGYTQILIDGEPAPAGFTIDSLAPSMIERIDVMRNGSAEFGTQAIAGSINIIMRKNRGKAQRDLTLGAGAARGYLVNPSAALRWARRGLPTSGAVRALQRLGWAPAGRRTARHLRDLFGADIEFGNPFTDVQS